MIKIEKVSKFYGKEQVLKKINLEFETEKIYGIVGENGAGKTTLFKCISGLETSKGKISFDPENLKDRIGFLLSEPFLFSKMTGKEYIQFLANAKKVKLSNVKDKNIFGLPINKYATTYSSGMKKKLALTAILLQQNDIFILDEPFNGVDIHGNILITEIIKKLKSKGKIVIVSSHIFSTLAAICDEIHLIEKGKIIKKVEQQDFDKLEAEMREFTIGNRIDKLVDW